MKITDEMVLEHLKEKTIPVAFRIPASLDAEMTLKAKELGIAKSALLTAIIKIYLEK